MAEPTDTSQSSNDSENRPTFAVKKIASILDKMSPSKIEDPVKSNTIDPKEAIVGESGSLSLSKKNNDAVVNADCKASSPLKTTTAGSVGGNDKSTNKVDKSGRADTSVTPDVEVTVTIREFVLSSHATDVDAAEASNSTQENGTGKSNEEHSVEKMDTTEDPGCIESTRCADQNISPVTDDDATNAPKTPTPDGDGQHASTPEDKQMDKTDCHPTDDPADENANRKTKTSMCSNNGIVSKSVTNNDAGNAKASESDPSSAHVAAGTLPGGTTSIQQELPTPTSTPRTISEDSAKPAKVETQLIRCNFVKPGHYKCLTCGFRISFYDAFQYHIWKHVHVMEKSCRRCPDTEVDPFKITCPTITATMERLEVRAVERRKKFAQRKRHQERKEASNLANTEESNKTSNVKPSVPATETAKVTTATGTTTATTMISSLWNSSTGTSAVVALPIAVSAGTAPTPPLQNGTVQVIVGPTVIQQAVPDSAVPSSVTPSSPKLGRTILPKPPVTVNQAMTTGIISSPPAVGMVVKMPTTPTAQSLKIKDFFQKAGQKLTSPPKNVQNTDSEMNLVVLNVQSLANVSGAAAMFESNANSPSPNSSSPARQSTNTAPVVPKPIVTTTDKAQIQADHIAKLETSKGQGYVCGFRRCTFSTCMDDSLISHCLVKHSFEYKFPCVYCQSIFMSAQTLVEHIKGHFETKNETEDVKVYSCGSPGCNFSANMKEGFRAHYSTQHVSNTYHRCKHCLAEFTDINELLEHLETNVVKVIHCAYCHVMNSNRRLVMKHIGEQHDQPRRVNSTNLMLCAEKVKLDQEFAQKCSACGKGLNDLGELKDHLLNCEHYEKQHHRSRYSCAKCHAEFHNQLDQVKHSIRGHGEKSFLDCPVPECSMSTSNPIRFHVHCLTHRDLKDDITFYVCSACAVTSNLRSFVRVHISLTHRDKPDTKINVEERKHSPYESYCLFCQRCNLYFGTMKETKHHREVCSLRRSKSTMEICSECNSRFDSLKMLFQHCSKKHERVELTLTACVYCTMRSTNKVLMKEHITKAHPGMDFAVDTIEKLISSQYAHCEVCDFTCADRERDTVLIDHIQEHHPSRADRMKAKLQQQYSEKQSVSKEPLTDEETLFLCQHCPFRGTVDAYRLHMVGHFCGERTFTWYNCAYCSFQARTANVVMRHSNLEHKFPPACDKRVVTLVGTMSEDTGTESCELPALSPGTQPSDNTGGIDRYHCDHCAMSTNDDATFRSHVCPVTEEAGVKTNSTTIDDVQVPTGTDNETHHPIKMDVTDAKDDGDDDGADDYIPSLGDDDDDPSSAAGDSDAPSIKEFNCSQCEYVARTERALKQHRTRRHGKRLPEKANVKRPAYSMDGVVPANRKGLMQTLRKGPSMVRKSPLKTVRSPFGRNTSKHGAISKPSTRTSSDTSLPGPKKVARKSTADQNDEETNANQITFEEAFSPFPPHFYRKTTTDDYECRICHSYCRSDKYAWKSVFRHICEVHLNLYRYWCSMCALRRAQKTAMREHCIREHKDENMLYTKCYMTSHKSDLEDAVRSYLKNPDLFKKTPPHGQAVPSPSKQSKKSQGNGRDTAPAKVKNRNDKIPTENSNPEPATDIDRATRNADARKEKSKENFIPVRVKSEPVDSTDEFQDPPTPRRKKAAEKRIVPSTALESREPVIVEVRSFNVTQLRCSICDLTFMQEHLAKRHLQDQHRKPFATTMKSETISTEKRVFRCRACNHESTRSYKDILEHRGLRHRGLAHYNCNHCSQGFKSFHEVTRHCTEDHADLTPEIAYPTRSLPAVMEQTDGMYRCPDCSFSRTSQYLVKEHVKNTHLLSGTHQCFYCDFGGNREDIISHVKQVHKEEILVVLVETKPAKGTPGKKGTSKKGKRAASPMENLAKRVKLEPVTTPPGSPSNDPGSDNASSSPAYARRSANENLRCPKCSTYNTTELKEMRKHLMRHMDYQPYKCDFAGCRTQAYSQHAIVKHSRTFHKGTEPKFVSLVNTSQERVLNKLLVRAKCMQALSSTDSDDHTETSQEKKRRNEPVKKLTPEASVSQGTAEQKKPVVDNKPTSTPVNSGIKHNRSYVWDNKSNVTYFCLACDYKCENAYQLFERHFESKHGGKKCRALPIHRENRDRFEPDISRRDGRLILTCRVCQFQCSVHTEFREHWTEHLTMDWKCGICKKYVACDKQDVLAHCRKTHPTDPPALIKNDNGAANASAGEPKIVELTSLKKKQIEKTESGIPYEVRKDDKFGCTVCNFSDSVITKLEDHHILWHKPRFKCEVCDHKTRHESDIKKHSNKHNHTYIRIDENTGLPLQPDSKPKDSNTVSQSDDDGQSSVASVPLGSLTSIKKRKRRRILRPVVSDSGSEELDDSDRDVDFKVNSKVDYESSDDDSVDTTVSKSTSHSRVKERVPKVSKTIKSEPLDTVSTDTPVHRAVIVSPTYKPARIDETNLKYSCCYCDEVIGTEYEFSLHLRRHLKLYAEAPPKASYDEERGLKTAKNLYYDDGHPYFCSKCGRSFWNLKCAKEHVTSSHRGASKVICLMFKNGCPSDERRMLTFEEYPTEDAYIEYRIKPLNDTDPELKPDFLPEQVFSLQPSVLLQDFKRMKRKKRSDLLNNNGVKLLE